MTGVIKDKAGNTLPGVTVSIKGTTLGIASNENGAWALELPTMKDITLIKVLSSVAYFEKSVKRDMI